MVGYPNGADGPSGRPAKVDRHTDLDWLRIGAFGLLILFHVGMFYVPWEWEVKSPRLVPWLQFPMEWSAPWRLLLLFVISGCATRFMSVRLAPGELWRARSLYLLPPLLCATLAVVPFQMYVSAVEEFDYRLGFGRFLLSYFRLGPDICFHGKCLWVPTWDHLWFVAYLWIYTSLLVAVTAFSPGLPSWIERRGRRWLAGWRLLVIPALALGAAHIGLAHFFPETHELLDDWYLHAIFFVAFLFGYAFVFSEDLWRRLVAVRWLSLGLALLGFGLHAAYTFHYRAGVPIPIAVKVPASLAYGLEQWASIAAALGFARRHLAGRDGPVRRYLTEAIFPYYIVHQAVIVVVAHELVRLHLALWLEATLLVLATVVGCALSFEAVRRVAVLRPWFGLKPGAKLLAPLHPAGVAPHGP
jgi:glucans biosynthesis protein C